MARPWDRLSPKDQLRLQEALFRVQLRRLVYPFSPFYRRLYEDRGIRVDRIPEEQAEPLRRALAPFGIRCRMVGLRELGQRMGVGTEAAEERVVIRRREEAPAGPVPAGTLGP